MSYPHIRELQLRDLLYSIVPLVLPGDQYNPGRGAVLVEQIKLMIKYIEKDIYSMSDDQKNRNDLIEINQELMNENKKLKQELQQIKDIISK